jgi:hypothetical protein
VWGETYQYLKMYWIVLLLVGVSIRRGKLSYLSWALLFVYLLLDDSLLFHERLGSMVASRLGYTPVLNLRAQDFGELTVVAAAGLVFAGLLSFTWWRGDPEFRGSPEVWLCSSVCCCCSGWGSTCCTEFRTFRRSWPYAPCWRTGEKWWP